KSINEKIIICGNVNIFYWVSLLSTLFTNYATQSHISPHEPKLLLLRRRHFPGFSGCARRSVSTG
ncbi:MAG: hypothetical protein LUP91_01285, partial [Methylococcaceae bacterium]|nr:hypothetical protein [Methylococcaceae bacterium]